MEINTNINASLVNDVTPHHHAKHAAKSDTVDNSFASSKALDGALQNTPDVRPEAVERARNLIADPNYPSADTVKQLSSFLADKLTSGQS